MTRRREQHRHLEQLAEYAVIVDSRGPCPGRCNTAYRRRRGEWERSVHDRFDVLVADPEQDTLDVDAAMHRAAQMVRAEWEQQNRAAWPARPGAPVWCGRCAADVRAALSEIPSRLLLTLETGETTPKRPDGSRVTDPVRVLSSSPTDRDGRVIDELACGHRRTRPSTLDVEPVVRCRTCIVSASVPEPGRLAPVERAARSAPRQPVSPAGSPAWLEADAAIQWLCSTAEQAAYALGVPTTTLDGTDRWPWRDGSTSARVRSATDAARFLRVNLDDVLALADPLPTSIGQAALTLQARLDRVSGMADDEHAVPDECPLCERRGVRRRGHLVTCGACGGTWDEADFDKITTERQEA